MPKSPREVRDAAAQGARRKGRSILLVELELAALAHVHAHRRRLTFIRPESHRIVEGVDALVTFQRVIIHNLVPPQSILHGGVALISPSIRHGRVPYPIILLAVPITSTPDATPLKEG